MINLSNNIHEAEKQLEDIKREVRLVRPDSIDVPSGAALTGHQMYIQFCYRMAKFMHEFEQPDPVIGGSWLNVGVTRLLNELEKRLLNEDVDRSSYPVFGKYIKDIELEKRPQTVYGLYVFDVKDDDKNKGPRQLPDRLGVYIRLNCVVDKEEDFPKWWPAVKDPHTNKWNGALVSSDYLEMDGIRYRDINFFLNSPFSQTRNGALTRPYLHRGAGGFPIEIYLDAEIAKRRKAGAYFSKYAMPNSNTKGEFVCERVTAPVYNWSEMVGDYFVDAYSTDPHELPIEYHNDIIDYAIDAYFESMFFHQFGKYSMKQARQDADNSPQASNTAMRQGKMDAVPPNRFKMTGMNAG